MLDGERLSYRSLDVEQIGSVYEAIMGYEVEQATTPAIGVWSKPKGTKTSVTVVVSVDKVLKAKANDRAKYLKDSAGCEISGKSLTELKQAKTAADLVAAIGRKVSVQTPGLMPVGSLYLQPGEERRRSGSHYTPRALTEPIVRETLRPVLEALGESPTPEQVLGLKVCDLAVGSGAFLVESCRQLADKLVESWNQHNTIVEIPLDEEPLLYARRLVAQRCLYGVDKNPFAVNLAKLSLWLVTLAKHHPFTFLDHALKCGDSLVGLTRDQITKFNWERDTIYNDPELPLFSENFNKTKFYRNEIQVLDEDNYEAKRDFYCTSEELLQNVRLKGDLVIASFFADKKDKVRRDERNALWLKFRAWQQDRNNNIEVLKVSKNLRQAEKPVKPFNWEIEFPEVFDRENPGFDAIVGNPPFSGGRKISGSFGEEYLDWLFYTFPQTGGQADYVAYFFRQSFLLLRNGGAMGLVATNTISQGDTRYASLTQICRSGGTIYNARKRIKWPGSAAVVVSVVHIIKSSLCIKCILDKKVVPFITAYLLHMGSSEEPYKLAINESLSFKGQEPYGKGFQFADDVPEANSLEEMYRLINKDKHNTERIFPYLGGEEILRNPKHLPSRYVINFGTMSIEEAAKWSDLLDICEQKVKVERATKSKEVVAHPWWQFWRVRSEMQQAIAGKRRYLAHPFTSSYLAFVFVPASTIVASPHVVVSTELDSGFAVIQSRVHEIWARFIGSSMKDDLRYTPTDCFQTFPFPENWETSLTLETIGKEYYEYRAALMVSNNQGLTDTYNRFHDPNENHPDILKLRQLHGLCDRAVLDAYGWSDISTECTFLLDYEEEEEESTGRQKKKPWRYRWSEEVHDEVLARLLQLNHKRAEAETLGGKIAGKTKATGNIKKERKSGRAAPKDVTVPELF